MTFFKCGICERRRPFFKSLCRDCQRLFEIVQKNQGMVGFSGLMDELIATQIDKFQIKRFLESNTHGRGSILDQITAALTNNLAEGMGVKDKEMRAEDVRRIRENPTSGVSSKPMQS